VARLKVAVLISGRGSNLEALMTACAAPGFPAKIGLVIANRADAAGLVHARKAGIATTVIPHGDYPDRTVFDATLTQALEAEDIELVCLAGFMRLLTAEFVAHWRNRLINIHPSLLPAFPGLDTHARVLAQGVRFTGCTVHFVRAEMDNGPIIVQAAVPVHPDDTAETLAVRVLEAEHRIYPHTLRLIGEGRVRVADERVEVADAAAPQGLLVNPLD
jgi:phosphoribosylglycinamide formyltransferase 1